MPIITDGLIGYWNSKQGFDGLVWQDLSGNGRHFKMAGNPTLATDGVYFDGVDDKGELPNNQLMPITSDYTIEFGIKLRDITATSYVVYGYDSSVNAHHRGINLNTSELLRYNAPSSATTTYTVPLNTYVHIQLKRITDTSHALYVNGVFRNNFTTPSPFVGIRGLFHIGYDGGSSRLPATISFIRIYSKALTDQELAKNFLIGKEVGLSSAPPNVKTVLTDKQKISDEIGNSQSIITVQFDTDVSEYVARLNGVDYSTGVLVHQGGAVSANMNTQVIIDWNELSNEGDNRINIYGKGLDGQWTPYNQN